MLSKVGQVTYRWNSREEESTEKRKVWSCAVQVRRSRDKSVAQRGMMQDSDPCKITVYGVLYIE